MIELSKVSKRYESGKTHQDVFRDLSFKFEETGIYSVVGPSGSGKTTLLNIIGGLDSATNGAVRVLEHSMDNTSHNERAKLRRKYMGFIFQSYNLLPVYTVFENIELPLILNKVEPKKRKTRVLQAIEWVGLGDKINSKPAKLSGGECQRTAIARALVHRPALVMADEPTANLDAENSHKIMKILVELNQELDTSFVFATHDEKIMGYLRRIIHMEDGKIVKNEWIDKGNA